MRSLPEWFSPKIATIEDAQALDNMRVDDLIENLQAFEMNHLMTRKDKGIAYVTKSR